MAEIKKVGCERLELGGLSGKTMGPGDAGHFRVVRGWRSFLTGVTRAVAACAQAS